jgi:metal-responsive CopG/Arc/MetJ family transcriptional regulator
MKKRKTVVKEEVSKKTLYVRGINESFIKHIEKFYSFEGFKSRGEFINALLKEGIKGFKALKSNKKAK